MMKGFPMHVLVVTAFCLGSILGSSNNDNLANEVADLKKTVIKLTDDINVLKKISKALDNLCAELHVIRSPEDSDFQEKNLDANTGEDHKGGKQEGVTEEQKSLPFQMHSFEVMNDTFRIEYDANISGEEFYALIEPNVTSDEPGKLISAGNGVITGPMTAGRNYVTIMAGEFGSYIAFDSNTTTAKIDIEPLNFNTNVRGSVTFERGQSQEVKVIVSKEDFNSLQKQIGLYTPSDDDTVSYSLIDGPDVVKTSDKEDNDTLKEITVTVNKNKNDQEGLLYLSVSDYSEFKGLDYIYAVCQILELRRVDHTEPFESGYIGFVKYGSLDFDVTCIVGKACALRATLVGNTPADITLWKIMEGKTIKLEVPEVRGEFGRYVLPVTFYVLMDSTEDQGLFTYRGTSHGGNVIQRKFNVTVSESG